MKEISSASKIKNIKTGKAIRYVPISHGFIRLLKRFAFGGNTFDSFRSVFNNAGNEDVIGNFFFSTFNVVVKNPNEIRNILSMKCIGKAPGFIIDGLFNKYLGDSLLLLNGEQWAKQRKVVNTAMSYSKIKEFISIFNKLANILMDKIKEKNGEFVEMNNEFTLMTFDVIGKAGFGYDFESLKGSQNKELKNMKSILSNVINIFSLLFGKLYDNLPIKRNKELGVICSNTDSWIDGIINERKVLRKKENDLLNLGHSPSSSQRNKDLLDLILDAEEEEKLSLSIKELHNNIFLFFFAGHDTSPSALTSVLYFLAKYPNYIEQAKEEVSNVLEGRSPSFDDLQKLTLCNAIIKETLRLIPPAPLVTGRVAEEDVEIGGYLVPKGTSIACTTFMCHFDERYWKSPLQFNPERFLDKESKESQKNAYFPFGYGPRRCPGDKFALAEICITLVAFLQNFKSWELKDGFKYEFDGRTFTTKPKGGLPIKFIV